jgi:hypothetical protein
MSKHKPLSEKNKRKSKKEVRVRSQKSKEQIKEQKSITGSSFIVNIKASIIAAGWYHTITLLIVTSLFLFFGLSHLGKFIWTDGPVLWYFNWVPEFWQGLKTGEWHHISGEFNYPGIPTLFLSGLITQNFIDIKDYPPEIFEQYMFWMRFPLVVFNYVLLFFIHAFSKRIWNKQIALLLLVLAALHPLTIGISQFVQGDTTQWTTLFLSVLSYFLYLKTTAKKYLFFTSLFFSLAVLSKFSGLILYPVLFFILFFEYLFGNFSVKEVADRLKGLLAIYLIFTTLTYILYPTTWTNLELLYKTTFGNYSIASISIIMPILLILFSFEIFILKGKGLHTVITKIKIQNIAIFSIATVFLVALCIVILTQSGLINLNLKGAKYGGVVAGNFTSALYSPFSTLVYILTWFSFFGFIGSLGLVLFKFKKIEGANYVFHLLFVFLSFSIGGAIAAYITWWKYQIIFIPFIATVLALVYMPYIKNYYKYIVPVIIFFSGAEIVMAWPNYFHFSNKYYPMAKVENKYDGNVGGYELAQKLNAIEGADTLKVLSDTYGFMYYFKGHNTLINKQINRKDILACDYLFLSSFGKKEKKQWNLLPYAIFGYYNTPLDSTYAYLGNKSHFVKLVKVNKNKKPFLPEGCFDTECYIDLRGNNAISFWMKTEKANAGKIIVLAKNKLDALALGYKNELLYTKKKEKVHLKIANLNDGNWHHVVWMSKWESPLVNRELYVDGELVMETEVKPGDKPIKAMFLSNEFDGEIDDVRVFRKALSNGQIQAIYNNGEITHERVILVDGEELLPVRHFTKQK